MSGEFRAVSKMTETEIEGLANHVKRTLGLRPGVRIAMMQLLEMMEDWFDGYIFHVLPDEEMPNMDGYAGLDSYEICLSNSTYVALGSGDPEARHTAAHELGHFMLHSRAPTAFAKRTDYHPHVDPEWQADCFADAFLMPASGVKECKSPTEVAERFSVPEDRAALRFEQVMKIQGELF